MKKTLENMTITKDNLDIIKDIQKFVNVKFVNLEFIDSFNVEFKDCSFMNVTFSNIFEGVTMDNSFIHKCIFESWISNWSDFDGCMFVNSTIESMVNENSTFKECNFEHCKISNFVFDKCNVIDSMVHQCEKVTIKQMNTRFDEFFVENGILVELR